jgi:alpha/beta hydrolase fold
LHSVTPIEQLPQQRRARFLFVVGEIAPAMASVRLRGPANRTLNGSARYVRAKNSLLDQTKIPFQTRQGGPSIGELEVIPRGDSLFESGRTQSISTNPSVSLSRKREPVTRTFTPSVTPATVVYKTLSVDGLNIAYREAGSPTSPKLVLFHGWPSSSHQYRHLIHELAGRFHVLSPDYPGFGNSDAPDPEAFEYTFDNIAKVIGKFLDKKGFTRFGMFVQDYGGPVGFRIVTKNPESLEWLIIQNTNAYEVSFSEA